MPDTYSSTYAVPKKTKVTIDETETDVVGYLNTCDSCKTCPDQKNGTSQDGAWKNGVANLNFTPHLDYSSQRYTYEAGTRQLTTTKGAPSWEDAGGFYFKRRSSKIKISPEADTGEVDGVCMYLIKCKYTVESTNQILNFFRGGPDRMLFLTLQRNTDEAFCDEAWPDSADKRKYQYFYLWRGIGDTAGDVYSNTLNQTNYSGHFYFLAKEHDVVSLEWWDHATRTLDTVGSNSRAIGNQDRFTKRVNSGLVKETTEEGTNRSAIIENGPGYSIPLQNLAAKNGNNGLGFEHDLIAYQSVVASKWGQKSRADTPHVKQVDKSVFSIVAKGDSYSSGFMTSDGRVAHSDYYSCTYDTNGYSTNMYDNTFLYPPTYGWHSVHDLSLGGSDAPNQDWELAKKKQDNTTPEERSDWGFLGWQDLCGVEIELSKKLVVIPQISVNTEFEVPLGSSYSSFVTVPTKDGSKQSISSKNHFDGDGERISLNQKGRTQDPLLAANDFNAKLGKNMNVAGRIGGVFSNGEGFTKANSTIITPFTSEGN